jgi:WD40 repeat protein
MTGDAKMIASASYQEVRLWQYPPGKLYKNLKGHQREVEKVIISDDDSLLISAGGKKDNTIRV